MWNNSIIPQSVPERMIVHLYNITKFNNRFMTGFDFIKRYKVHQKISNEFFMSDTVKRLLESRHLRLFENILEYTTKLPALFKPVLKPYKRNDIQCTAIISNIVRTPMLVNIPCDQPIL